MPKGHRKNHDHTQLNDISVGGPRLPLEGMIVAPTPVGQGGIYCEAVTVTHGERRSVGGGDGQAHCTGGGEIPRPSAHRQPLVRAQVVRIPDYRSGAATMPAGISAAAINAASSSLRSAAAMASR